MLILSLSDELSNNLDESWEPTVRIESPFTLKLPGKPITLSPENDSGASV